MGTYRKKLILHLLQEIPVPFIGQIGNQQSQVGIQLIDSTIRLKADMGFRHTGTPHKRSSPFISGFGIYLHISQALINIHIINA